MKGRTGRDWKGEGREGSKSTPTWFAIDIQIQSYRFAYLSKCSFCSKTTAIFDLAAIFNFVNSEKYMEMTHGNVRMTHKSMWMVHG